MSQDIAIKKSSISGKGVFAKRNFKKGEVVLAWHPIEMSQAEAKSLAKSAKHYVSTIDGKYLYMQPPERYVNHSCEPNTETKGLYDVALREIRSGEEITSDYSGSGLVNFECLCGSPRCRHHIA